MAPLHQLSDGRRVGVTAIKETTAGALTLLQINHTSDRLRNGDVHLQRKESNKVHKRGDVILKKKFPLLHLA